MQGIKIGDIVARKSYDCDILFKVINIRNEGLNRTYGLKGILYRIEADAPDWDLELQSGLKTAEHMENKFNMNENNIGLLKTQK